ncbi:MAG: ubiquinone/menaquinone biosynthesis methyltransferase [Anaerolineales bacterium]|nr:ubiquinone/menaquinone biosynthesis methyltransferase [Anaerolineales bacterium]
MTHLTGSERSRYVQAMFTRIAHRYDRMNRLMTAGQDVRWRREVIQRAGLPSNGYLLDLGAGTGDLAREALRQHPASRAVAADFTLEMMRMGRRRLETAHLVWSAADALQLPYPQDTFDAVVSGFLLRNVSDIRQALREQYRLLKPGGRVVSLDTTRPPANILSPVINLYLHVVIPTLGKLVTGDSDAYKYLPDSTEAFLGAEQLASRMIAAGFREVGFRRVMFGTVAIHWGTK